MLSAIIQFISRTTYRKEIIIVITVKVFALFIIWEMFFSNPIDEKLTRNELVQHFLGVKSGN